MSFYNNLTTFSDNIAIIDDKGNKYTYSELNQFCNDLTANFLTGSKKLVFLLSDNSMETIVAYLGCLQTNNVVLLLDAKINKSLLQALIKTYSPDFIWSPKNANCNSKFTMDNYEVVPLQTSNTIEISPSLNLLLSTSGTTGSPKMIKLTKENLQANALSISQYLKLNVQERAITSLPLHYSYGLSVFNSHLLVGATILLTKYSVVTKDFWKFFSVERASSFSGVPFTYEILKKLKFFEMDLPSIRYITQAGGKLNPKLVQEYAKYSKKRGFEFYVMYGQTEATARIAYLPPENNLIKFDSIGVPIPGGKLWHIDESGNTIHKPYVEGELIYSGPNVMMGYAESREDLQREDELRGILKTGDLAYFDEDGFFYITGRLKRFLKIYGNRVNIDDIEHHLKGLGFECYCGGEDDRLLIASLQPEDSSRIKEIVIQQYKFHHSTVEVLDIKNIPKNTSNKILYQELFGDFLQD